MILFLVNTTSQLINAIVLSKTILKDNKCDLYYTPEVKIEIEKLVNESVFNRIYSIELPPDICGRETPLKRLIVRIKNAVDFIKVKKNLPSNPLQYTRVFASGISLRNFEFYYAIKHFNPNVRLSLFEEGSCEYYTLGLRKSLARSIFSHFFFGHYYFEDCDSLYVYNPLYVQNIWENIEIRSIPNYSRNKEILGLLNNVFDYREQQLFSCNQRIIILEQAFANEGSEVYQERLISHIDGIVGVENLIIKLHPRSLDSKYPEKYRTIKTNIPLELIIANEINIDKIFISISSSAVLNLKLIFDIEPYSIILNRLGRSDEALTPGDKLYSRIQESCREKRFFIPHAIEELDQILERIQNNLH